MCCRYNASFLSCLAFSPSPSYFRVFYVVSKHNDDRVSLVLQSVYSSLIYVRAVPSSVANLVDTSYVLSGFPGEPAAFHEPKTKSMTSSTPVPSLMLVKIVGPSPLMSFASRPIIARDADTNGAISICWTVNSDTYGRT